MYKYKADKSVLIILIVIELLLQFCIIPLIVYKKYYITTYYRDSELIIRIVAFALITTYAAFTFVMLPMWYRSLCYFVSSDEIIIQSGVIVKKRIYVKMDAIQYTTVVKCPIFFKININVLLIDVYGERLKLPFLRLQDMEEINKIIHLKFKGINSL